MRPDLWSDRALAIGRIMEDLNIFLLTELVYNASISTVAHRVGYYFALCNNRLHTLSDYTCVAESVLHWLKEGDMKVWKLWHILYLQKQVVIIRYFEHGQYVLLYWPSAKGSVHRIRHVLGEPALPASSLGDQARVTSSHWFRCWLSCQRNNFHLHEEWILPSLSRWCF